MQNDVAEPKSCECFEFFRRMAPVPGPESRQRPGEGRTWVRQLVLQELPLTMQQLVLPQPAIGSCADERVPEPLRAAKEDSFRFVFTDLHAGHSLSLSASLIRRNCSY